MSTDDNKITTFSGLKAAVEKLQKGQQFVVGPDDVAPELDGQLIALGLSPIKVTFVDSTLTDDEIVVNGTGNIFKGMDNASVSLTFALVPGVPDGRMTLDIIVEPAPTAQIPLFGDYYLDGAKIAITPNIDVKLYVMDLECNISIGGETIPVGVQIPAYPDPGYWLIGTGASYSPATGISGNFFQAISNGLELSKFLPAELNPSKLLDKLTLNEIEFAFDPKTKAFAYSYFSVTFTDGWKILGPIGIDKGDTVTFNFRIAFDSDEPSYIELIADFVIEESVPVNLGAHFAPGNFFVWGQLQQGSSLSIHQLFTKMNIPLPKDFPKLNVDRLGLTADISGKSFTFDIGLDLADAGILTLGQMASSMTVEAANISGNFTCTLVLDETTTLFLAADYSNDSLTLTGKAENIKVSSIVSYLEKKVHAANVPSLVHHLELETLTTTYDTSTGAFTFNCEGSFTITGEPVTTAITIDLEKSNGAYEATFGGTFTIGESSFAITFSAEPGDLTLTASWTADNKDYLQFENIAGAFGFKLPDIPTDLDLSLKQASFTYAKDTTNHSDSLLLGAESANYGNAVFVSLSSASTREHFFLLGVDKEFKLKDLPLIGNDLSEVENIRVGNLQIIICSEPVLQATATAVNALIAPLGQGYPSMPATGTTGKFVLSAQLFDFGGQALPLMLGMDAANGGGSGSGSGSGAPPQSAATSGSVVSASSPDGTVWFTVQKSFGPVNIQKIGVRYLSTQQTLWLEIDASLALGSMTLTMTGLGIGSSISDFSPQLSLQGFGIAYTKPPLAVAGSFVNLNPPAGQLEFDGSVMIGAETFELQAFGFYGNQCGSPSMFIFGDLAHDFGGPPAFFVTGVALGFGYNSALRLPDIDQVASFPFIEVLPDSNPPNPNALPGNTPQQVLPEIMNTSPPWVTEQSGALWFAAGITFTSFELVNSQALVVVEPGADLTISLIGTSRAQFPQNTGTGGPVYANIVLDLDLTFIPEEGVFALQAVLSRASFLLDPACILTGGFAFYVWFGDNPHSGDFVLTLGGYNPGFVPPAYYPAVPELGFHWSLDSSITISGNAYLAFTPSVLMVGGGLLAVYQSGNLKAWFDAHADIIVQWKPFWIDAQIGICIGASYRVDLLFTSFTISVELGCELELWGPPTGGHVHVDWYIISFTIPFGASKYHSSAGLTWADVQAMLPNTGTANAPNILSLTPAAGLSPSSTKQDSGTPPTVWIVRGSRFGFSTSSSMPATTATVGGTYEFNGSTFNVAPLISADPKWSGVSAAHEITITEKGTPDTDFSSSFIAVQTQKSVPSSLWGSPSSTTPKGDGQLIPSQIIGVALQVRPPQLGSSAGPVNVLLRLEGVPLNITGATLPISGSAQPSGDIPANSQSTIATIIDPDKGIASSNAITARNAIFAALAAVEYAPATLNDPMTKLAGEIGSVLSAEPLLV